MPAIGFRETDNVLTVADVVKKAADWLVRVNTDERGFGTVLPRQKKQREERLA